MLARIFSAAILGIDAKPVIIEADVRKGMPGFQIVGLPDSTVRESRERIISSIRNSGFEIPNRKITINLAPADFRKEGSAFDLPIALGILAATGQLDTKWLPQTLVVGELGLGGTIKPVRGILALAIHCKETGWKQMIVPGENFREAWAVGEINCLPVRNLKETVLLLTGKMKPPVIPEKMADKKMEWFEDYSDVRGQEAAKRIMQIAAAGFHNLLAVGSPGCGKTMLIRRLPSILPEMSQSEILQTSRIHSVAGILQSGNGLVTQRPFRSPHHSCSLYALVGAGVPPRPGEISLAHNGVLFMDELPEFNRPVLESLRQPLESGEIMISRASASVKFPSRFLFAGAMNPCPCANLMDPKKQCRCRLSDRKRYLSRISGPLLDRIDLHLKICSPSTKEMENQKNSTSSSKLREKIQTAVQRQLFRNKTGLARFNSGLSGKDFIEYCKLDNQGNQLVNLARENLGLSVRGWERVLKVSRTIADLEDSECIREEHLAEALQYRSSGFEEIPVT